MCSQYATDSRKWEVQDYYKFLHILNKFQWLKLEDFFLRIWSNYIFSLIWFKYFANISLCNSIPQWMNSNLLWKSNFKVTWENPSQSLEGLLKWEVGWTGWCAVIYCAILIWQPNPTQTRPIVCGQLMNKGGCAAWCAVVYFTNLIWQPNLSNLTQLNTRKSLEFCQSGKVNAQDGMR